MPIKIDNDVPVYTKDQCRKHTDWINDRNEIINTLGVLKIGQSFFVAGEDSYAQLVRQTAYICGGEFNKAYVTRSAYEDGQYGIRVWRVV